MNSLETHHQNKELCPYLGLRHDRRTAMNYPSPQNYCHNVTPPAIPGYEYQSQFCLTAACSTCKLYAGNSRKRMPANIASAEGAISRIEKIDLDSPGHSSHVDRCACSLEILFP